MFYYEPRNVPLDLCGKMINDQGMSDIITYPKYACQFCGSMRKLVETVIDDEFIWNDEEKRYEPDKFSDNFEHTGEERCECCGKEWTGIYETTRQSFNANTIAWSCDD